MKYNQSILLPVPPPLIGYPLDRVSLSCLTCFSARTVEKRLYTAPTCSLESVSLVDVLVSEAGYAV